MEAAVSAVSLLIGLVFGVGAMYLWVIREQRRDPHDLPPEQTAQEELRDEQKRRPAMYYDDSERDDSAAGPGGHR